jgi:tetratricopeptide (TPR) repeat protein
MKSINLNNKEYSAAVNHFKKNDFNKTIEVCRRIKPTNNYGSKTQHLLALALTRIGKYSEALVEIEKAFVGAENKVEIYQLQGNINREIKNYENAIKAFKNALDLDKNNSDTLHWTAVTMYQMGLKKPALKIINDAISIRRTDKYIYLKARCLEDLNFFGEALNEYDSIIEKDKKNIQAIFLKCDLLRRMFKYDLALELADKAMKIDNKNINCYLIKSVIYKDCKRIEESLDILNEGLKVKPNSEQANFNKSIILLQSGNLKEGWELYEWRWRVSEWTSKPFKTSKPKWNGEKNVSLYLWSEQGIGDEVMFASIYNDIKKDVQKLTVKVDIRLKLIFERSFPGINFVSENEIKESEFEYHLPVGSMAKFYRNTEEEFSRNNDKFLKTNEEINHSIKKYFSKYEGKRKIGISWKSKNPLSGLKRSAELEDIINYINDDEAVFINLQYGDVVDEISKVKNKGFEILNIEEIDNMKNIDGLLSIIEHCDEVISIDNSTVHFAGALGKKTEVLMHESADFRWEMQGNTTKWYKSLTLKRNIIL